MSQFTQTIKHLNYRKIINILSWAATGGIIGSVIYVALNTMNIMNPVMSITIAVGTPVGFAVLSVNSFFKKDFQALIFFIVFTLLTATTLYEYIAG